MFRRFGNSGLGSMRLTEIDVVLARRALALGAAALAVFAVVIASTDEQSVSPWARLGRLASVIAGAGAVGSFLAAEQARSRGEVRAMAALGVAPWRAALGPALGGAILAAAGPALALWQRVDLRPLFPRVGGFGDVRVIGADSVLEASRGVVVHASGALERMAGEVLPTAANSPLPRVATAGMLLTLAIAAPCWAALPLGALRRLGAGSVAVLACVVVFHLVAAERAPVWTLPLAPLVLLLDAAALCYRDLR